MVQNSERSRVAREQFKSRECSDIVGAGAGGERQTKGRREARWKMGGERKWFDGRKVRVKDKEGARSSWGSSRVMEDCNRMRDSRWQGEVARKEADRGWERKTVIIDMVEAGNNMVAKTGGEKAGTGEARGWGWEQTDGFKTKAHPTTSMDRIIIEGRGGRSHVKQPRIMAPTECKSREVCTTVKISRKGHKEEETG
jgi:hypothetical protein